MFRLVKACKEVTEIMFFFHNLCLSVTRMLEKIDCTDCGFFGFQVTFSGKCRKCRVSISLRQKARKASSASVYYFVLCLVAVKYNRQGKSTYRYSLEQFSLFTFQVSKLSREPIRTNVNVTISQWELADCLRGKTANAHDQIAIGFNFESDWLGRCDEISGPAAEQSKVK